MRLQESKPAIADSNGKAIVTLQPLRAFERWRITLMNIQATSPVAVGPKVPQFRVYRNSEAVSNLVDSTYDGNQNTSNTDITIENGEAIIGVWTGADPGTQCMFSVQGERLGI